MSGCLDRGCNPIDQSEAGIWRKIAVVWWYTNHIWGLLRWVHRFNMEAMPWVIMEIMVGNKVWQMHCRERQTDGRYSIIPTGAWAELLIGNHTCFRLHSFSLNNVSVIHQEPMWFNWDCGQHTLPNIFRKILKSRDLLPTVGSWDSAPDSVSTFWWTGRMSAESFKRLPRLDYRLTSSSTYEINYSLSDSNC